MADCCCSPSPTAGAGFAPEMLDAARHALRVEQGRPGGGLGLFLVFNVVRKLGGQVAARQPAGGRRERDAALPLAAFTCRRTSRRAADVALTACS